MGARGSKSRMFLAASLIAPDRAYRLNFSPPLAPCRDFIGRSWKLGTCRTHVLTFSSFPTYGRISLRNMSGAGSVFHMAQNTASRLEVSLRALFASPPQSRWAFGFEASCGLRNECSGPPSMRGNLFTAGVAEHRAWSRECIPGSAFLWLQRPSLSEDNFQ